MGKRPRDEPKNKPLPRSRDQSDSSYDGHISDSLDHKSKAPRLADQVVIDFLSLPTVSICMFLHACFLLFAILELYCY